MFPPWTYDLAWNLAGLERRTGRADRIGSKTFRERAAAPPGAAKIVLEIGVPFRAGSSRRRLAQADSSRRRLAKAEVRRRRVSPRRSPTKAGLLSSFSFSVWPPPVSAATRSSRSFRSTQSGITRCSSP
jgi:hypothetical protein